MPTTCTFDLVTPDDTITEVEPKFHNQNRNGPRGGRLAEDTIPGGVMTETLPQAPLTTQQRPRSSLSTRQRVVALIDGHNLHNGQLDAFGRRYLWLDVESLAEGLLKPGQDLAKVILFTARFRKPPEAVREQIKYLEALQAHCSSRLQVVEGRFQEKSSRCRLCGALWTRYEEKETDVSIAAALIGDGVRDEFDTALLISADGDLSPAIREMWRHKPGARVVVAVPPKRKSAVLKGIANGYFPIGETKLRQAQLPEIVKKPDGTILRRPVTWQ